jgi:hypothetical protein
MQDESSENAREERMNWLTLALGSLLLVATSVDLLWTTLWIEGGAGPFTARLMAWSWWSLRKLGGWRSGVRTLAGPTILALGITMWIAALWVGWTLVFAGAADALTDTIDGGPVSWVERFYFVGYTLFTMGNGDFAPRDGVWQVATALTTASGMLFVTLIITYVLSVLDAVTQKRTFASDVSGLGTRGEHIVREGWNGDTFAGVDLPLNTITSELNELTANHKAYPILHYFYTDQRETAAVLSVAALADAVTLWQRGIPEGNGPSLTVLGSAQSSLQNYLDMIHTSFVTPSDENPPPPDLAVLRDAGVPTVSDDEFTDSLAELEDRRRTLLGLIEADARQWPGTWDDSASG